MDYTTPILVFGHFLLPLLPPRHATTKDEENQDEEYKADEDEEEEELQIGEAGEWFHTSRYGGVPVIALGESYQPFLAVRIIDLQFF